MEIIDKGKNEKKREFDLNDRLIRFSAEILLIAKRLPNTTAGKHLNGQLIRSGTSPVLQYGEAQSAESGKDFIHKMKVALKELRETFNCLKVIILANLMKLEELQPALKENDELISIFVTSIKTAQRNNRK
jgi:four helix bundle protein